MAASSSNHHSPRGSHVTGGGGGGGGVSSPSFQQKTSLPYAKVVRGERVELDSLSLNNEHAVPLADSSALQKDVTVADNDNSSPIVDTKPTSPAVAPHEYSSDGNNNVVVSQQQQPTKPVWNKVSNGTVEVGPVMGAVSWPALSECTSKVSSRSNDADNSSPILVSNGVLPAPQGPKASKGQGAGSSNNPGTRHSSNGRPRQAKRGSNSAANGPRPAQGGFIRAPPTLPSQQPPPAPLLIQLPAPQSSQLPSPSLTPPPFPLLDFSQGNYGFIPVLPHAPPRGEAPYPRPMPGLAPSHGANNPFSQRSPSRRPRGEGPYNNNLVGRPDRNPDFAPRGSNGRNLRMQYPRAPPPGNFMRHQPPGSSSFIAPPLMGPYPNPMAYNEMRQPFIIFPAMVPDHLRNMHFLTHEPTSPMGFPTSDIALPNLLLKQINFYFSDANLERDEYLRSQMDEDGWVPITVIASFSRVRQLTHDIHIILEALQPSTVVEVKDSKIRKRNEWKKYVKPVGEHSADANSANHSSEKEPAKDPLGVGEAESSRVEEDVLAPIAEEVVPATC